MFRLSKAGAPERPFQTSYNNLSPLHAKKALDGVYWRHWTLTHHRYPICAATYEWVTVWLHLTNAYCRCSMRSWSSNVLSTMWLCWWILNNDNGNKRTKFYAHDFFCVQFAKTPFSFGHYAIFAEIISPRGNFYRLKKQPTIWNWGYLLVNTFVQINERTTMDCSGFLRLILFSDWRVSFRLVKEKGLIWNKYQREKGIIAFYVPFEDSNFCTSPARPTYRDRPNQKYGPSTLTQVKL